MDEQGREALNIGLTVVSPFTSKRILFRSADVCLPIQRRKDKYVCDS